MPTPKNAPYKKAQRKAEAEVRNRGKVLWVSSQIAKDPLTGQIVRDPLTGHTVKRQVQGTYDLGVHGNLK